MKLSIELPDIQPLKGVNAASLTEMLMANLYHLGKLSEKEARSVLKLTRREFEDLLPNYGFSILADSSKSIAVEAKSIFTNG